MASRSEVPVPTTPVQGNTLGLDVTGSVRLGGASVIVVGANNLIGGTAPGAGNVIVGGGVTLGAGTGNVVQGNLIGTNAAGATGMGGTFGVHISGSNHVIGGTTPAARNVISGNSLGVFVSGHSGSGHLIQGNYIGTDPTGNAALPNGSGVRLDNGNHTIGGLTPGAGNVISGNANRAIDITSGSGVKIQGNLIGTNAAGTAAIPNGTNPLTSNYTVALFGTGHLVQNNVISGNRLVGVHVFSGSQIIQGNFIGTNAAGTSALGNGGSGVVIAGGGRSPDRH